MGKYKRYVFLLFEGFKIATDEKDIATTYKIYW